MNRIEISVIDPSAALDAFANALLELGLLERTDSGWLEAPFDEVIIHAGIRDAA